MAVSASSVTVVRTRRASSSHSPPDAVALTPQSSGTIASSSDGVDLSRPHSRRDRVRRRRADLQPASRRAGCCRRSACATIEPTRGSTVPMPHRRCRQRRRRPRPSTLNVLEPELVERGGLVEPEVEAPPASLRERLAKARSALVGAFSGILARSTITDETLDDLEEALLKADVGVTVADGLLEPLPSACRREGDRRAR